MNINTLLKQNPRSMARGAPMGDTGFINPDALRDTLCCQVLQIVDGAYGPDGTYWGCPSNEHGRMYVIFNATDDEYKMACGVLKYYRAKSRADAIAQFNDEWPGFAFKRGTP